MDLVNNNQNFDSLFEKITELLNSYTQSIHLKEYCLIEYALPIFNKILN